MPAQFRDFFDSLSETECKEKVCSLIPAQKYLREIENYPVFESIGPIRHVLMESNVSGVWGVFLLE